MKFKITLADGGVLNGDPEVGQKFDIADNGTLTFFDAPEGHHRSTTTYAPHTWVKVQYVTIHIP